MNKHMKRYDMRNYHLCGEKKLASAVFNPDLLGDDLSFLGLLLLDFVLPGVVLASGDEEEGDVAES